MAFDDPISILVDCAQVRVQKPRNLVLTQGAYPGVGGLALGWDLSRSSNVAVDPATFTAFIGPYQQSPEWYTTFTGNYARLGKAAWTLSESAKWKEDQMLGAGDTWLLGSDLSQNTTGITAATYGKNRGWYLAFLNFNLGGTEDVVMECGWHSSPSLSGGVGLKIFSSGRVEIYKGGVYRGFGNISGVNTGAQTDQQWVSMLVIPGRGRELMFIPNRGTGFSFEFEELEGVASPEIVPATNFWFRSTRPAGHTHKLQFAPITYPTSGTLFATESFFAVPPDVGDPSFTEGLYFSPAHAGTTGVSYSLRDAANVANPFVADGVKHSARVRLTLTGDGNYTPFVYGSLSGFGVATAVTDDSEECDLLDATTDRLLKIDEAPGSSELELHAIGIQTLLDAGMSDPIGHSHRPIKVMAGGHTLWEGLTLPVRVEGASSEDAYGIEIRAASLRKMLEDYTFPSPVPLNGATWKGAVEYVVREATGLSGTALDVEDPGIIIGDNGAPSRGEWSLLIEAGDNAADWLDRLFEAFAGDWFYDFVPDWVNGGTKFMARSPSGLGTTVNAVLWGTVSDATAQLVTEGYSGAVAGAHHRHRLWRAYEESRIEPEANEVRITGLNPRTGQPLQAYKRDTAAQNATLAPSARPVNWCGYPKGYWLAEPMLTTQELVEDSVTAVASRVMAQRRLVQFESTLIRLSDTGRYLWKGDRVTLKNVYDGEDVTVRITAAEFDFDLIMAEPWRHIEARYMGEVVSGAVAWRGNLRASNIQQARALAAERQRQRIQFQGLFAQQLRQPTNIVGL